jgi:hypothetical protein
MLDRKRIENTDIHFRFCFCLANLYTNVEGWPDLKSLPTQLGEIGGIALTNGNNELVVFSRGSRKWEFKYD